MLQLLLHAGQPTSSPSQATAAPLIVWLFRPVRTVPLAVVLAPTVM
jgi:hypothetical protein